MPLPEMRIGEGKPDLTYFILVEEVFDEGNAGTDKSNIFQPKIPDLFTANPHPRPFNIHANKIPVGIALCKPDGIFPLATTKLKYDRIIIPEELIPCSFQVESVLQLFEATLKQERKRIKEFYNRAKVKAAMKKYGIDVKEAQARIDSLTDKEVRAIAKEIDTMPAGAGALETVLVVLLILIILELMGVTNIFKKF